MDMNFNDYKLVVNSLNKEIKQLKEDLENTINQLTLRNTSVVNLNKEWANQKLLTLKAEGLYRELKSDYNKLNEKELREYRISTSCIIKLNKIKELVK